MRTFIFLMFTFWLPLSQAAQERLALVIGNSQYEQLNPLKNPRNDAKAIAAKLKAMGFTLIGKNGKPTNGPVRDLDQNAFINAYLDFAQAAEGAEIALIYYAGHGMQIGGQSYLLPTDVPKKRVRLIQSNAIKLDEVLLELDGKAKLTVAVFDACREIPELDKAIQTVTRSSGLGASAFRGLARVQSEGRSRLVAFAGAAGQLVKDGKGSHSPYTGLLLDELDKDTSRPVEQVFQDVAYGFGQRYGGQNPEVLIQGVRSRTFYFVPAPPGAPGAVPIPPGGRVLAPAGPDPEILYWQSVEKCGTAACYQEYLRVYPRGRFAGIARLHFQTSQPQQPEAPSLIAFTVKTSPEADKVRILNIGPKYRDGIELKPGKYRIEATKSGYKKHLGWHELTEQAPVYMAELEKLPPPPPKPVYSQPKKQAPARVSSSTRPQSGRKGQTWRDPTTGMEFVWVPKGCFQMGSNDGGSDEKPVHEVCLEGYWLGKYEVTQGQWRKVMGSNPSKFKNCGSDCPVEQVSWDDVQDYIRKLNRQDGPEYRLPTEAEWEYACRSGGRDEKYSGGNSVDRVAWYRDNAGKKTHRVGSKSANGLGLHDMSGNVWEWVQDIYDKSAYRNHARNNPVNTSGGSFRVGRGGSWGNVAGYTRCAYRGVNDPDNSNLNLGFRLLRK